MLLWREILQGIEKYSFDLPQIIGSCMCNSFSEQPVQLIFTSHTYQEVGMCANHKTALLNTLVLEIFKTYQPSPRSMMPSCMRMRMDLEVHKPQTPLPQYPAHLSYWLYKATGCATQQCTRCQECHNVVLPTFVWLELWHSVQSGGVFRPRSIGRIAVLRSLSLPTLHFPVTSYIWISSHGSTAQV